MKSWQTPVALTLAALALLCAVYVVALGSGRGLAFDQRSLVAREFAESHPRFRAHAADLLRTISISSIALLGIAMVAFALIRMRTDKAIAVGLLVGGATATAEVLKPLLGKLDPLGGDVLRSSQSSFPSGHATVAMALALGAVLVSPASVRIVAAVGGAAYTSAVGVALVLLGGHFPSDVAGGFLVAAVWAALAVVAGRAVASAIEARRPGTLRIAAGPAVATALLLGLPAAFAAVLAVSLYRQPDLLSHGALTGDFVAAAAGIAAVALAVIAAFAFVPLERPPEPAGTPRVPG